MKIEIENIQPKEVDWSKNPQLVIGPSGDLVVIITSDASQTTFSGINTKNITQGITEGWNKAAFRPFHGKITLQNDNL